ncbi:MAG: HEPN domain-containing protein [bacterium]|nr:HEPN domain-containing protein [bacterium]
MTAQQIDNKIVREWFLSAQDDEWLIENTIKEDKDWPPNPICFLSQQLAEKSLKGFLAFSKQEAPKAHQLEELIKLCAKVDSEFLALEEDAEYLTGFYIISRYPGEYQIFSQDEAREAFKKAIKIKDFIFKKMSL